MKKKILPLLLAAALLAACAPVPSPQTNETKGETAMTDPTPSPAVPAAEGNALFSEPLRPAYHYTAKNSWINDPNGLVFFKGLYHLSYQTTPGKNFNSAMYWGHAVGEDPVRFTEAEPVLAPDASGSIWSGTAWPDTENRSGLFDGVEGGGLIAAYSTNRQQIGIAWSTDGFSYTKLGIVIPNTEYKAFRDPKLFWDGVSGRFTMVVAGGTVRFYQSDDLRSWTCVSVNEKITTECPDFFPMRVEGTDTEKWVLTCAGRHAYVGSWNGRTFTPETGAIPLTEGPDAYAGITFEGTDGRRLMVSWQNNWSYSSAADGIWNGAMTAVTELKLEKTGASYRFLQTPAKEYASLEERTLLERRGLTEKDGDPLAGVSSNTCRLRMEVDLSETTDFTLTLCRGEGEGTVLSFDREAKVLLFDRSVSLTGIAPMKTVYSLYRIPLSAADLRNGVLSLELFLDVSCLDLFLCGGAHAFFSRIQPLSSSRGMSLTSSGRLKIDSLSVTEMKNIHFAETEAVDAVHADPSPLFLTLDGGAAERFVSAYDGSDRYTAECLDPSVASVEKTARGVRLTPLSPGVTSLRLVSGSRSLTLPLTVAERDEYSSDIAVFSPSYASLLRRPDGLFMTPLSEGNGFAFGDVFCEDTDFSARILPRGGERAAALLFRASDRQNFYALCADIANRTVKIWMRKKGAESTLASVPFSFESGKPFTLRVLCRGDLIEGFVDAKKVIAVRGADHPAGAVGLNVWKAPVLFNDLRLAGAPQKTDSDLTALFPVAGVVGKYGEGFRLSCPDGDGFAVADFRAADFTFSADITVGEGTSAGALLFRYTPGNFYVATVDVKSRILKLWKRVNGVTSVLSTVPVSVAAGETHTLTVNAAGPVITLSLDGKVALRASDRSHTDGKLGLNVFRGSAVFEHIRVETE